MRDDTARGNPYMRTSLAIIASTAVIFAIYAGLFYRAPIVTPAHCLALHGEPAVTLYIPVTSNTITNWVKAGKTRIVLHQLDIGDNTGVTVLIGTESTKCQPEDIYYVGSVSSYPKDAGPCNYSLDMQQVLEALINSGKLNVEPYGLAVTLVAHKLDTDRPSANPPFQIKTVYVESQ